MVDSDVWLGTDQAFLAEPGIFHVSVDAAAVVVVTFRSGIQRPRLQIKVTQQAKNCC